jgi:hypothetical protein
MVDSRLMLDWTTQTVLQSIATATFFSPSMDTGRIVIECAGWTQSGIITTVAGSAKAGLTGDGGSAFAAGLQSPSDLLFDRMGNLYVVDPVNDRVRHIDMKTQFIKPIAGSTKGFGGDDGPAVLAMLDNPSAIAIDSDGISTLPTM